MNKYLVGGAVRDKALGLEPKDRDWLIVGATPVEIQSLLDKGYEQVGADFPVFLHPTTREEYALARVERKTGKGYGGFSVKFDENVSLEDDLARRDLTINSMAQDENEVLHDPFGGMHDLRDKILRHTTEAFAEDPLRVLRLARFAARYESFSIAPETIKLCQQISKSGELNELSEERIWVELKKGFLEKSPLKFVSVLFETSAVQNCNILQELFSDHTETNSRYLWQNAVLAKVKSLPPENRLVATLGIFANSVTKTSAVSSNIIACINNCQYFNQHNKRTAETMHLLLMKFGALQEGSTFKDVMNAMSLCDNFCFTRQEMIEGQKVIKEVKAAQFPDLEGRELGAALNQTRIDALKLRFSL